jgi:hypothetical protein
MRPVKINVIYVDGDGAFHGMGILTDQQMIDLDLEINEELENEVTFEGEYTENEVYNVWVTHNGMDRWLFPQQIDQKNVLYQIEAKIL